MRTCSAKSWRHLNLWRAREDAVNMRPKVRQQLKAFLLRQDRRYAGKTSWTNMPQGWIADQRFGHPAAQIALTEYQLSVQIAEERVQRLTAALQQAIQDWRVEPVVAALRALRGIDISDAHARRLLTEAVRCPRRTVAPRFRVRSTLVRDGLQPGKGPATSQSG